jgi:hypothetical protein
LTLLERRVHDLFLRVVRKRAGAAETSIPRSLGMDFGSESRAPLEDGKNNNNKCGKMKETFHRDGQDICSKFSWCRMQLKNPIPIGKRKKRKVCLLHWTWAFSQRVIG